MAAIGKMISNAFVAIAEAIDSSNKIWIVLHNHTFVGGDVVTGTVEMDCLVPFTAKGVIVRFKGFERSWFQQKVTEWVGEGSNRRSVERIVDHRQNKEFFKASVVVYPHQGIVNPGHYSFPFSYQLPTGLPGTYFDKGTDAFGINYHAMVLYKAKATVDVHFRHNLHSTTRLVVNEKFDQLLKPSYGENSKSFMFTNGNLQCRVWLDKNAYIPGETVLAKLKANNTSVKPTRRINIKVKHILHLKAHGHSHHIQHVEHQAEYPGFEPCFLGVRWMPFYIPVGRIRPSSEGQLVHSSYIFEVECDIPGAVDLKVDLPIRILAPQFLWSSTPVQPPNAPLPPNIQIRPPWQPDEAAPKCNGCPTSFGIFTGRTHCRNCGKVFCKKCTATEIPVPKLKFKENVRICTTCLPIVRQTGGTKYQSTKQVLAAWQASLPAPQPVVVVQQQAQAYSPPMPYSPAPQPIAHAQPPQQPYSPPPQSQQPYSPPPLPAQYGQPQQYPSPQQPAPQSYPSPQPAHPQAYPPQQAGYPSPQQTHYAPPPQGQGYAPPPQGYAPPPQGQGYAPPPQGQGYPSPQQTHYAPPPQGYAPPPQGYAPPPADLYPSLQAQQPK